MIRVTIREILSKENKSVYWLANQTGIHYNNLSKIVNNETKSIKYVNIESICLALDCTPNDLFEISN